MKQLVEKAIEVAVSQNGVRERGENTGKEVDAYLRSVGCPPGNPWCAAFVYWSVNQAADTLDVPNPLTRTAYCPDIANWGRENGILDTTPERGAIFLRYGKVGGEFRACHTGLVTGTTSGAFQTVEGNTNDGGSREGIGVFLRNRPNSDSYKFVHWAKLAEDASAPQLSYGLIIGGQKVADMPVINGTSLCPVRVWGQALGFKVGWSEEDHLPTMNGEVLAADISVIGDKSYAPVRQLVQGAGLKMDVDNNARTVTVHH